MGRAGPRTGALLPDDFGFVMHLPVAEEYVNVHQTTFHLGIPAREVKS